MAKAFLIGAGATRAEYPSAPLSSDFFMKLKDTDEMLFNAIKTAAQPYLGTSTLEKANVEDVMLRVSDFHESARTSFLESLYLALYKLLSRSTESDVEFMEKYRKGDITRHPTLFKTLLNSERLNEDDFFMSLNYDLYLDREVWVINDSVDFGIPKEFVNVSKFNLTGNSFSVYHLHGSMNWEIVGDNKIDIHLGAVTPRYIRRGSNLCLMPPGDKEIKPIIKSIWEIDKKRLLKATELIIIGCSLNPKDVELIKLIENFVKQNGTHRVKVIYLYNPKEPSQRDRYKAIIGHGFREYCNGFSLQGKERDFGGNEPGAIEFIFSEH